MFDIESWIHRRFDVVAMYGQPVTDLRVNCPFCPNGDDGQHLHINLQNQRGVHCFKCDYKRTWLHLVMDVDDVPYHFAFNELYVKPNPSNINKLKDELQERVDKIFHKERKQRLLSSYGTFMPLYRNVPDYVTNDECVAKEYLVARRFGPKYWKRYGLGVFLNGDYMRRVVIPVEADFFQSRAIYKWMKPKYLTPKDADNTQHLFNSVALDCYDEVIVCEGAFSAMAAGDNAIALIGKNPTIGKVTRMLESNVERFIITCEKGAERNMLDLAEALYTNGKHVDLLIYDVGDPADEFAVSRKHQFEAFGSKLRYELVGNL